MPAAHLHGDSRFCGATTEVTNQSSVYVNDKLWAVVGDENSHKPGGALRAVYPTTNVEIEDKLVIVAPGDEASADSLHPEPDTWPSTGSGDVSAY